MRALHALTCKRCDRRTSHVYAKVKVTTSKCIVTKKMVFAGQASKLSAVSLGYSFLCLQQEKIVSTFV